MEHVGDTVMAVCVWLMKKGSGSTVFKKTESLTEWPSESEYEGRKIIIEVPAITVTSPRA